MSGLAKHGRPNGPLSFATIVLLTLGACDRVGSSVAGIPGATGVPGVDYPFEPSEENFVWPPPIPDPVNEEDARCRGPDEQACESDPGCLAETRPSSCTWDGGCTEEIRFAYYAPPVGDE